jgi:hypothetical protein
VNTFPALLALWHRGHLKDCKADARQRTRAAWQRAIAVAEAATIFDGARKWIAAADAPRFLPPLDEWLDARGWEKDPPPKKQRRKRDEARTRSTGNTLADAFHRAGRR